MAIEVLPNLEIFGNILNYTDIGGVNYLLGLVLVILTTYIVSNDKQHIKNLLFPIAITWHMVGINQHILVLIATGIVWTINLFSMQILGNLATSIKEATRTIGTRTQDLALGLQTYRKGRDSYKLKQAKKNREWKNKLITEVDDKIPLVTDIRKTMSKEGKKWQGSKTYSLGSKRFEKEIIKNQIKKEKPTLTKEEIKKMIKRL